MKDFIDLPLSLGDLKPFQSLVVGESSIEKLPNSFLYFVYCMSYFWETVLMSKMTFLWDCRGFAVFTSSLEGFKSLDQQRS